MRSVSLILIGALASCAQTQTPTLTQTAQTQTRTESMGAPAATHTPPRLRLPETVRPTAYAVRMKLSPLEERFSGQVDVQLEIREATDVLWLHAGDNLDIKVVSLWAGNVATVARTERAGEDLLGLAFDHTLRPGAYRLHVAYEGKLPSHDGRGAYRQEEHGDWYIFTQLEAIDARRAFPCFDEPGFKTPYQLTLEVPKDQLAFANTPQTEEKVEGNWKTVSFATSKPLPSYLVAFAVGPFEVVDAGTAGHNHTPIRIIVPRGRSADAKYAVETTGKILERLEAYFGIAYPYEKLDHIAVPQKGGAMENPGLITFGTTTILSNHGEKSLRLERGYIGIASHELGHIWTGDYVTTAWWDDIWLNEAFATWISSKITDEMHPEWDGKVQRVQSRNYIMGNDSLVSARRIRQPVESKHDIANAFDGITYQKGGAVIAMFEAFYGEENFKKGVHHYLSRHAYGNATATDFLTDVGATIGRADVFALAFSTFLNQPGLPLVTAELACEKGAPPKLLLSQQRYLPQGSTGASEETWNVPVCASYPGGKSCVMMMEGHAELPLDEAKSCPAWVNPNAGATGYYRVLYKGDGLARLLKSGDKTLSVAERVSLFGDALALAHSGRMPESDVLALVPGLVKENNRHLVGMTTSLVGSLSDHMVTEDVRPNYRRLVNKLYGERARKLGWHPKAGEDDDTMLLRPQLLSLVAEEGEDKALAAEARALAGKWLADRKAVDPDLAGTVLQVAARHGDRAFWDQLHAAAKSTQDRRDRGQILGAMGGFRDPAIVQANFAIALSDEFDARESMTLVWGAMRDPRTRQLTYDFVKKNFDRIQSRMPRDWGAQLIRVAGGFCDAEHRADAESFFKQRISRFPGGPRNYAQTIESINLCTAERSAQQPSVVAFLKKY